MRIKKKSLELRYASFGIPGAIPGANTLPDTSECYLSTEPGHESGTKVEWDTKWDDIADGIDLYLLPDPESLRVSAPLYLRYLRL